MWAVLVLTLAVVAGASDPTNESAVEEKPVIARAKLMVSGEIHFVYKIFRIVCINYAQNALCHAV